MSTPTTYTGQGSALENHWHRYLHLPRFSSNAIQQTIALFINGSKFTGTALLLILTMAIDQTAMAQLTGGQEHTIVVCDDGDILICGNNVNYQLGNGTNTTNLLFQPLTIGSSNFKAVDIASGSYHNIALAEDSTVWTWGLNTNGQGGFPTSTSFITLPQQVPGLPKIIDVAAGENFSLALDENGKVWAWGLNNWGQLSDSNVYDRYTPMFIKIPDSIMSITAGSEYSLALTSKGTVYAWGRNNKGQLGNGGNNNQIEPVMINLKDVVSVAAGREFSMALLLNGTVKTWGNNNQGQLGLGSSANAFYYPQHVPNLKQVIQIAAGLEHAVALQPFGTVWAWGNNIEGQIGIGTNNSVNSPSPVLNLPNPVVEIGAGFFHTIVKDNTHQYYSWGYNAAGQLGNGSTTSSNLPDTISPNCPTVQHCEALFTWSDSLLHVQFTDASVGGAMNQVWLINDSIFLTGKDPSYHFSDIGPHHVWLFTKDVCGYSAYSDTLLLTCPTPEANFTIDNILNVIATTNTSTPGVDVTWDFGDGFTSSDLNPSHQYTTDGRYNIQLVIANACGRDTAKQEVAICVNDCRWPGDADHNGRVNMWDLLPIATNWGTTGPAFPDNGTTWGAGYADDWASTQLNGSNMKHADTDGNGVINEDDLTALELNIGKSVGGNPNTDPQQKGHFKLRLQVEEAYLHADSMPDTLHASLYLDKLPQGMDTITGFAATIRIKLTSSIETHIISISVDSSQTDLGSAMELLHRERYLNDSINIRKLEFGLSRKNKKGGMGKGKVVSFIIITTENITNANERSDKTGIIASLEWEVSDILIGSTTSYQISEEKSANEAELNYIFPNENSTNQNPSLINQNTAIAVFPNPVREVLHVQSTLPLPAHVTLFNYQGEAAMVEQYLAPGQSLVIDTDTIPNGFYFIKIWTEKGSVTKKIMIQK